MARRFGDPNSGTRVQHAASAALDAAAVEAVRVRNQPGEWVGAKGIRVATAALGAAAVGSAQNQDSKKSTNRQLIEATVSGLLANRVVNGPRKELKRR